MTRLHRLFLPFALFFASAAFAAVPPPPQLAAKSWVLMDAASGAVLVNHEGGTRLPPASL
ncbi:MAG: serine-type D-Ala-D-Ala carboxypeptidase, partial [Pseudomonadota bacterium]